MLLKNLLPNVNKDYSDIEIKGVTCDSRKVEQGFAFVCICGTAQDGHDYARLAVEHGAAIVISEHKTGVLNEIIVSDTHIPRNSVR